MADDDGAFTWMSTSVGYSGVVHLEINGEDVSGAVGKIVFGFDPAKPKEDFDVVDVVNETVYDLEEGNHDDLCSMVGVKTAYCQECEEIVKIRIDEGDQISMMLQSLPTYTIRDATGTPIEVIDVLEILKAWPRHLP